MKPSVAREVLERSKSTVEQAFGGAKALPVVINLSRDEYKQNEKYAFMEYGYASTPYAEALIAFCGDIVCHLSFVQCNIKENLSELQRCWENTEFTLNTQKAQTLADKIFTHHQIPPLLLKGTELQCKVWQALLHLPKGTLCTYQDIAHEVGKPKAVRAVASSIGANEIAYLIPCHRVVGKSGAMSGYRWGIEVKERLLHEETGQ
mgnify:FL=1